MAKNECDRTRWLLGFINEDLGTLTPGGLLDLWIEVSRFSKAASTVAGVRHNRAEYEQFIRLRREPQELMPDSIEFMSDLQTEVRLGVDLLASEKSWKPIARGEGAPRWVLEIDNSGSLVRRYEGPLKPVFLHAVSDLLLEYWPQLHRCEDDTCGKWFLMRHGKQKYHDPACSNRVRQRRFRKDREEADS